MSFLGRLNYSGRFIARSTVIIEPILKLLKKGAPTKWTEDCQKAFDTIKRYLSNPPILVTPRPGSPLLLYMSVSENAFGCMLAQNDKTWKKERTIYYISKKFTPCESSYSLVEKTCRALTWVSQKVRYYMVAYTTHLISRMEPLMYIFRQPIPIKKLAKWKMLLSKFDIQYVAQKAVNGQALADLLAGSPVDDNLVPLWNYFPDEEIMTIEGEENEDELGWKVYFDGAVNFKGSGIGVVLVSDSGQYYPVSAKLNFNCTNNMVEYEACILGLRLALYMGVQNLQVIGHSDLLIHQVRGEWATKNEKIIPYVRLVQRLADRFQEVKLKHIPRTQNEFSNTLATMASMI
ncbi:uncharacterized protein LOC132061388 [Lycium ferocissimum]|uniref:uncharacterized protein LOC132061388 n=1 Tax=Lycium ferocissimum TaxID=112874 RepID=UPI0028156953|nr:uncharacterized protein LOC132061388 [Lycium ferocissimum]